MAGCDPLTDCGPGGPCPPVPPRAPRCDNVLPDGVFPFATVYVSNGCITSVSAGQAPQYTPEPCCGGGGGGGEGEEGPPGPPGPPGAGATVSVGNVTTLSPGAPATVVNVGTSTNAVLDFGIPAGQSGSGGSGSSGLTIDDAGIEFEDGLLKSVVNWPPVLGFQVISSPVDVVFSVGNPNQTTGISTVSLDLTTFRQNILDEVQLALDALQGLIDGLDNRLTQVEQNCCS